MAYPVVGDCCCGCSLQTGTYIIVGVQLVCSVYLTIDAIVSVNNDIESENLGLNTIEYDPLSILSTEGLFTVFPSNDDLFAFRIIIACIQLFTFSILLTGVCMKLPSYINMVVILGTIEICISIPIFIFIEIRDLVIAGPDAGLVIFVFQGMAVGLKFYALVVISSFRKAMIAQDRTLE